jgi:hypothetical protein
MVSSRRIRRSASNALAGNPSATPQIPTDGLNMGMLGDLGLNAFRDTALRAGRLESHDLAFVIGRDMREHEAAESNLRQAQKALDHA